MHDSRVVDISNEDLWSRSRTSHLSAWEGSQGTGETGWTAQENSTGIQGSEQMLEQQVGLLRKIVQR